MYLISCFGRADTTQTDGSLEPSGCFQQDLMDKSLSHLNLFKMKLFQNSHSVVDYCNHDALRHKKNNAHVLSNWPFLAHKHASGKTWK